ncbi:MAG: hypothetical protein IT385_05380 [Deltaproteobacteria bacterium]|nr:hypothetical protein [Deltaproteobacteria bacterium]
MLMFSLKSMSLLALVGLSPLAAGCDDGAPDPAEKSAVVPAGLLATVQSATLTDCNQIIVGLDLAMTLSNPTGGTLEIVEVQLSAADGSVVGTSADLAGVVLAPHGTEEVALVADSCVDPALTLSTPSATNVDLLVEIKVKDRDTGLESVGSVQTSLLHMRAWDNCATGFGEPGEGCAD